MVFKETIPLWIFSLRMHASICTYLLLTLKPRRGWDSWGRGVQLLQQRSTTTIRWRFRPASLQLQVWCLTQFDKQCLKTYLFTKTGEHTWRDLSQLKKEIPQRLPLPCHNESDGRNCYSHVQLTLGVVYKLWELFLEGNSWGTSQISYFKVWYKLRAIKNY